MEISIDLKLMREIVFKDEELLKEMLSEWITDSNLKLLDIKDRFLKNKRESLFNKIHELKTNFSMINCSEGIRFSETIVKKIERDEAVELNEIEELEKMVNEVIKQLYKFI